LYGNDLLLGEYLKHLNGWGVTVDRVYRGNFSVLDCHGFDPLKFDKKRREVLKDVPNVMVASVALEELQKSGFTYCSEELIHEKTILNINGDGILVDDFNVMKFCISPQHQEFVFYCTVNYLGGGSRKSEEHGYKFGTSVIPFDITVNDKDEFSNMMEKMHSIENLRKTMKHVKFYASEEELLGIQRGEINVAHGWFEYPVYSGQQFEEGNFFPNLKKIMRFMEIWDGLEVNHVGRGFDGLPEPTGFVRPVIGKN